MWDDHKQRSFRAECVKCDARLVVVCRLDENADESRAGARPVEILIRVGTARPAGVPSAAFCDRREKESMTKLSDEEVKEIAKDVANSNNVSFATVQTSRAVDSAGVPAIEIKFVLTPGSTSSAVGLRSALTTSQLIQRLADAGEELPIVRYEERSATSRS